MLVFLLLPLPLLHRLIANFLASQFLLLLLLFLFLFFLRFFFSFMRLSIFLGGYRAYSFVSLAFELALLVFCGRLLNWNIFIG